MIRTNEHMLKALKFTFYVVGGVILIAIIIYAIYTDFYK